MKSIVRNFLLMNLHFIRINIVDRYNMKDITGFPLDFSGYLISEIKSFISMDDASQIAQGKSSSNDSISNSGDQSEITDPIGGLPPLPIGESGGGDSGGEIITIICGETGPDSTIGILLKVILLTYLKVASSLQKLPIPANNDLDLH